MVVYQAQANLFGRSLIAGSFGPPFGHGGGLSHVTVDPAGRLRATPIRTTRPLESATFVCAVADEGGADLYAVERSANRIAMLRWRRAAPDAAEIVGALEVGEAPCHVTVDPARGMGVVSAYGDGSLTTFARRSDGSIHRAVRHVPPLEPEERPRSHVHCALFIGPYVVSTDVGLDRINVWRVEPDGVLTWMSHTMLPAGSGPRHLRRHPSGEMYVVCEGSGAIATLDLREGVSRVTSYVAPPASGSYAARTAGPADAAELAFSDDGRLAFVGMRADDALASYVLDDAGSPAPTGRVRAGRWPRHHVVSGDLLLVAYERSDEVVSFRIDPTSGALQPLGRAAIASPSCLASV
jgi:6-phosphogluconolactonase (cycloisomerase 2 family)